MDLIRKIIGLLSFTGGQGDLAGKGVEASLAGDACLSDELWKAMQTNLVFMSPGGDIFRMNWKATQEL